MAFGAQRLVSPLDWSNTRRTFDGASAIVSMGRLADDRLLAAAGAGQPLLREQTGGRRTTFFYGLYATGFLLGKEIRSDLYWLGFEHGNATWNGTTGDEKRQTLGARPSSGVLPGTALDFDVEGAYQLGEVGSGDVNACMVASQVGWWFEELAISPRASSLGFDWASGDESPGGDVQTFNQLFPLSHQYYGWIDAIAVARTRSTLSSASCCGRCRP